MAMAGRIHQPVMSWVASATPVPAIAPMMYWPSAPMFQTLARKPIASPSAIITSGAALTPRSGQRCGSRNGVRKMLAHRMEPVIAHRREDDHADQHGQPDRDQRAGIEHRRARLAPASPFKHGPCASSARDAMDAAHHQADLVDPERGDVARGRQPALVDDAEPVGELEQLVEILRDHHHGRALGGEIDQLLPDRGGSAGIHAPGRLADDEHAGRLADLAAHDELLQVAARKRARQRRRPGGADVEALDHGRGEARHVAPADDAERRRAAAGGAPSARRCRPARNRGRRRGRCAPRARRRARAPGVDPRPSSRSGVRRAQWRRIRRRALAGKRGQQLRLAIAGDAGDAEDLAGPRLERDVLQIGAEGRLARKRQRLHRQPDRARAAGGLALDLAQLARRSSAPPCARVLSTRGSQVATTLPPRRIVAASQSALISCSLCEM